MPDMSARGIDNKEMQDYWHKVSTIIAGQDAILEAGETYLPKLPAEEKESYNFRLQQGKFTNLYRDIVEGLCAKPFEKEVTLNEDAPEELLTFAENVDGEGQNLTVFAADFFFNGVNDAICWLFVDHPATDPEVIKTRADAKAAGIRPFWSVVLGDNVREVKTEVIGGERVITYMRIFEPGMTKDDDRVRVFNRTDNLVTWEIWERNKKNDDWEMTKEGDISIPVVPLIPFITGRRNGKRFVFQAALKDAVDLQMILYRQESALEYAKTMTAFPMLSASGVRPPDADPVTGKRARVAVGPNVILYAPPDGSGNVGQWSYIEPSATSLTFLQGDVEKTKQDLRELGKQPLTIQAGLTVIATAYASGKSKSALNSWGLALKDTLENAFVITCRYLGIDYDPQVTVYDGYGTFTEGDFAAVQSMRESGDITQETLWTEAKRRGVLSAEFDSKTEAEQLLKETPYKEPPLL